MSASRESLAFAPEPKTESPAHADLGALYHGILTELAASLEGLVAEAFAKHAAVAGLPVPPAVRQALAVRAPVPERMTAPVPPPATPDSIS